MNEWITQLFSLSLSGSLLVLLLLLLKKLYQNRLSKCWQYYILLAAALRFLLPFAPDAALAAALLQTPDVHTILTMPDTGPTKAQTSSQQSETEAFQPTYNSPQPTDRKKANQPSASTNQKAVKQPSGPAALFTASEGIIPTADFGNMSFILFFLWLAPALTLLVKKITSYHGFVRFLKTAGTTVDEISILNLLASCEEACNVKAPAELYYSPHLTSPVLTGFFHPCITIPEKNLPVQELSMIFTHELYHYKRRDLFYKWLIQAVVCIHWFNPFVYLLEREVNHACELSCDEAVIHSLPPEGKKAYGDMLLSCTKAALFSKNPVTSLTLAQDAKLLKERLGAIMRFQQPSKKTKLAAAALTAGICIGSAAIGAYATPARPIQAQNEELPVQAAQDVSSYQKLLALRTDSYQNQTVRQFRDHATDRLDTPQGTALLEQALQDEALRLHRLDNEDAFFLRNTLMLATGSWKKAALEAVGVERPLKNGQLAELDFKASIKLNNPDIKVSEYEAAYRGLADTANAYLMSKTDAELSDVSSSSVSKLSEEAFAAFKKYAKSVNKKGNLTIKIYMCIYSAEGTAHYELPEDIQKVLTLKVNGYQEYTLQQFLGYITERYEADPSLWNARQRLWEVLDEEAKKHLSKEDAQFLTTTLPCTESESTYPGDRVADIPPDFSGRYTLPYPKHGTQISFEWTVQYKANGQALTVGERDRLIFRVQDGMDAFIKNTWESADIGSMNYLKKMRRRLDELVKENSVPWFGMTVFHCLSDGKSA